MKRLLLVACLVALAAPAMARPDLRLGKPAGPLVVYPDDRRADLYYYPPGEIVLASAPDGRPELHLLQMRYTGSVVSADRGTALFRSVLSFKVRLAGPGADEVRAARAALGGGRAELRPLPIRRLDTALVYAAATDAGAAGEEETLPGGHFEAEAEGRSTASAYWRERDYTLGLDNATSQLFRDALQKGQVVISLGYAFHADGIPPGEPLAELCGSPRLLAALREQAAARPANGAALVRAGATAIRIDARRWPELLRQVDVNEAVPPGYAALDVYCYDFSDQLRPDLAEKEVDIEAEGVGGQRIRLATLFRQDQPDLYARGLRFPLAVRLDRPYRYRVTEVMKDGSSLTSPWRERPSWSALLDVTSAPNPPEETR
ncbi:MAG: hypothetical protein PHS77_00700 [Gallionellaceae bacterium]|nr:hypothetical protein [Gallionellaceae bacterium]